MGGHCKEPPYKIPDYRQFQIKGIPQLEQLEKALAKKGLRDPWIRNEAWRYHPGFGTRWSRARSTFFRGFGIGLVLTIATLAGGMALDKSKGHNGHGNSGSCDD